MSNRYRVLSMWDRDIAPEAYDALNGLADLDIHEPDRDWLLVHIHEYDAYLAALPVRFDREVAERAAQGRLKMVYTPSTGLDHLDLDAMASQSNHKQCPTTSL